MQFICLSHTNPPFCPTTVANAESQASPGFPASDLSSHPLPPRAISTHAGSAAAFRWPKASVESLEVVWGDSALLLGTRSY